MARLTHPQRVAILRLSRLPMRPARYTPTSARRYSASGTRTSCADELRNGQYQLTRAGLHFAVTGEAQGSN